MPLRNTAELPASAPDDPSDEAWQKLGAELLGQEATPEGLAAAQRATEELETRLRRLELKNRLFEASDLLVRAPAEFPDREALISLLSAAERLGDPLLADKRPHQLRSVLDELRRVTSALEAEGSASE